MFAWQTADVQEWMPNCDVCDPAQLSFSCLNVSKALSDFLAQHWSVTTLNFTLSSKSSGPVGGTNKTLSETISCQVFLVQISRNSCENLHETVGAGTLEKSRLWSQVLSTIYLNEWGEEHNFT